MKIPAAEISAVELTALAASFKATPAVVKIAPSERPAMKFVTVVKTGVAIVAVEPRAGTDENAA